MRLETKFQDEDFELGEVVRAEATIYHDENKVVVMADKARGGFSRFEYNSIKDFTDHWEDAPEEPKEHWAIDQFGEPINVSGLSRLQLEKLHRLGNDFPSENATMKAIEKLKAFERLKDKGFRFDGYDDRDGGQLGDIVIYAEIPTFEYADGSTSDDLDLLFSQEDD